MSEKTVGLEEFKTIMSDLIEDKLSELKTEKKAIAPEGEGAAKKEVKKLEGEEKELKFFQAVFSGNEAQAKALSEGTDSEGGYLVPTEFYGRIVAKRKHLIGMRSFVNVIPMSSDSLDISAENAGATVYWPAENADSTESNPSFAGVTLDAELMTILVKTSRQLVADAKPSILDYLAGLFVRAANREEDRVIIAGSGSGQPTGFRTTVTTAAVDFAGTTTYSKVVDLLYSLPAAYRINGKVMFMGGTAAAKALATVLDLDGRPIFNPKPDERGLKKLLGYDFLETDHIPSNLGGGTDASELWLANLDYYAFGDREQFSTEASTQAGDAFQKHQVWLKGFQRIAGKVALAEAFVFAENVK